MLLYLDNCALNRPFDDQTQARIWLETLSLSLILGLIESGEAEHVRSSVHLLENSRNPLAVRRLWVARCLWRARHDVRLTEAIRIRAHPLESTGIKALDALHIAGAKAAGATQFITCDDRLIRRCAGRRAP